MNPAAYIYYQDDAVTLWCGDWRDVLPATGGYPGYQWVDAIITDPPYGDTSLDWDKSAALGWLEYMPWRLKPSGSVWFFSSLRYLMALAPELANWRIAQEIIWEKHNGSSFHADRFKRVHEFAVQLYPEGSEWSAIYKAPQFTDDATKRTLRRKKRPAHTGHIDASHYQSEDGGPKLMRSVIYARSCHGEAVHPTQKPTAIVAPLVRYSVPKGGLVLDIFAGSGTTGVVARALGCKAILIEKDAKHCRVAADRLMQKELDLEVPA